MNYDKYYTPLYEKTQNHDIVKKAGWINKPTNVNFDENIYTTPVDVIKQNPHPEVSVLLYPGCFAPIHEGHFEAMTEAKKTIENTGEIVAAGFFSPDHDDYILRKTQDSRFIAPNRITLIQEKIQNEKWMKVDPWAAMYAPTDLNFTTLYDRFLTYLQHWVPEKTIKLYLVFGGDNYLFANAFTKHGHGVCVPREGTTFDYSQIQLEAQLRVVFSETTLPNHSSTELRKKITDNMFSYPRTLNGDKYVIRNDLSLAFPHNPSHLTNEKISSTIINLIEKYLEEPRLKIEEVNIENQIKDHPKRNTTISLDCFWEGEYNLAVTRLFLPSDNQTQAIKHINRPGTPDLEEQILPIPAGKYILIDDDIATGNTVRHIASSLKTRNIDITHYESLIEKFDNNLYDVVDMRDFVLGANYGGLTVETPTGNITRVPYMAPYVNLHTRAKIPSKNIKKMSKELWKLNFMIYKDSGVTLDDIQQHQNFIMFGFRPEMTLEDFCQLHLKLIE